MNEKPDDITDRKANSLAGAAPAMGKVAETGHGAFRRRAVLAMRVLATVVSTAVALVVLVGVANPERNGPAARVSAGIGWDGIMGDGSLTVDESVADLLERFTEGNPTRFTHTVVVNGQRVPIAQGEFDPQTCQERSRYVRVLRPGSFEQIWSSVGARQRGQFVVEAGESRGTSVPHATFLLETGFRNAELPGFCGAVKGLFKTLVRDQEGRITFDRTEAYLQHSGRFDARMDTGLPQTDPIQLDSGKVFISFPSDGGELTAIVFTTADGLELDRIDLTESLTSTDRS